MSTYKTPKGNTVEINWRNHESKGPDDIDYLLDQADAFVDATRAYKKNIDNIAVVYHVTKNQQRKVKPAPKQHDNIVTGLKKVVKKAAKELISKKTSSKKTAKKK